MTALLVGIPRGHWALYLHIKAMSVIRKALGQIEQAQVYTGVLFLVFRKSDIQIRVLCSAVFAALLSRRSPRLPVLGGLPQSPWCRRLLRSPR